jgi:hypothetical protein
MGKIAKHPTPHPNLSEALCLLGFERGGVFKNTPPTLHQHPTLSPLTLKMSLKYESQSFVNFGIFCPDLLGNICKSRKNVVSLHIEKQSYEKHGLKQ